MSIEKVKEYFKQYGRDNDIIEPEQSSATVELAAQALGVEPARIAKSLSLKTPDSGGLSVTAGDAKIDNKKFKTKFGIKAKMLTPDEVIKFVGHEIGGVCPFAIKDSSVKVYCDITMKRFDSIFPACGSSNSAIELTCKELEKFSHCSEWVDVCKLPDTQN